MTVFIMNASITNNAEERALDSVDGGPSPAEILELNRDEVQERSLRNQERVSSKFFGFIDELQRRQVCRTITMYSVALWLICQVLDVISPELDLPEWTLKFVIVIGLIGLPIALILSWLFDLTPTGIVANGQSRQGSVATKRAWSDRLIDCSLVLAALLIGIQLATGILSTPAGASAEVPSKIAVLGFQPATGNGAGAMSHGLVSELQHEVRLVTPLTVIVPSEPYRDRDSHTLTGAVAVSESTVRVNATLINNETKEVIWTRVFETNETDPVTAPSQIAKDIASALPVALSLTQSEESNHASY